MVSPLAHEFANVPAVPGNILDFKVRQTNRVGFGTAASVPYEYKKHGLRKKAHLGDNNVTFKNVITGCAVVGVIS